MKPYETLTAMGKKKRLRKVAELALEHYDLELKKLEYLIEETNVFFKVYDTNNQIYALKIFQEESSTMEDNLVELFFIETIQKGTDIVIPEVVYTKIGEGIVTIDSKYTPIVKRVALYGWIEGMDLDGSETYEWFYRLGILTAKLHQATDKLHIPKELSPKSWNEVFYYNGEVGVYKEERYQNILSDEYHRVMDFIIPYLNEKLPRYYKQSEPQLIHADLNPWNIKIYEDELRLLDFEEAMLGYPIHDFAIMLFYYRYNPNFNYDDVKKIYFEGYTSIRFLPVFDDYDLELLMTARRVNFLNYVLQVQENPSVYIERNIPRVKEFIENYVK